MPDFKKIDINPSLAILIAGVLIAGSIIFIHFNPTQVVDTSPTQLAPAPVPVPAAKAGEHIIGSPSAPIVLIEYSDFQCPFCQMIYPTLKQIVEESNGQIAWVMRNFPLTTIHPQAKPAGLAAECVADQLGNDGWWKFTDTIFANQNKLSPEYYAQVAAELGANPTTFASCVSSEKFAAKLDQESLDAQVSGGTGTPFTLVVGNGLQVPISGALPYPQIKAVIKAVQARQQQ